MAANINANGGNAAANNLGDPLPPGNALPLSFPLNTILSRDELERAHTIKNAAQAYPQIKMKLTDFEYVQWALAHPSGDDETPLQVVLQHIAHMEAFRNEYNIVEGVEEGLEAIEALTLQQPGALLVTEYVTQYGNCAVVDDMAAFRPGRITQNPDAERQHAIFVRGIYYRLQAMHPHHYATRQGTTTIIECEGATTTNFDPMYHQRLVDELLVAYPKKEKEVYFVNSPTVVNVMFGLWKRFMSPRLRKNIHLEYQMQIPGLEEARLSEIHLVPTPEAARQRQLCNIREMLQIRYHHQATYRLPSLEEDPLVTIANLLSSQPPEPPPTAASTIQQQQQQLSSP